MQCVTGRSNAQLVITCNLSPQRDRVQLSGEHRSPQENTPRMHSLAANQRVYEPIPVMRFLRLSRGRARPAAGRQSPAQATGQM